MCVIDITDHKAVTDFCKLMAIDFVVVGPDAQVVAGLGDDVRAAGFACFCPSKAAGQLEGSKGFTKALCDEMGIPTAAYGRFDNEAAALAYVYAQGAPIVIKADGLAAGKGVTVAMTVEEAEAAVIDCFSGAFGESGAEVVIEEFMEGEEVSLFVLCDGVDTLLLTTAQDHKRAFDGDTGPNTGGMGAYSPADVMTPELLDSAMNRIIAPTVRGLADRGTPYQGVLYAGLMLTAEGPKLVEYNARFGDPETQVMMMRLQSDLLPLLHATATGTLAGHKAASGRDDYALTVIMATRAIPAPMARARKSRAPKVSTPIRFRSSTRERAARASVYLLPAGACSMSPRWAATVGEAQQRAYRCVDQIDWPEGFCRRDIGWRAIARPVPRPEPFLNLAGTTVSQDCL